MDIDIQNDTFYMVLSSDGSLQYHKDNKPENFTIQFDKHIEFQRKMEVAMVELVIPNDLTSIQKQKIQLVIENPGYDKLIERKKDMEISFKNIKTAEDIYKQIQQQISDIFEKDFDAIIHSLYLTDKIEDIKITEKEIIKFEYKEKKIKYTKGGFKLGLVYIDKTKEERNFSLEWYLDFGKYLNDILGLEDFTRRFAQTAKNEIKLPPLNKIFYIHSDIVIPSHVNNTKLNLLRIVSKTKKVESSNVYVFNPLLFIPVKKFMFNSVNIMIKDGEENIVNFSNGKSIVILLFRPLEHI